VTETEGLFKIAILNARGDKGRRANSPPPMHGSLKHDAKSLRIPARTGRAIGLLHFVREVNDRGDRDGGATIDEGSAANAVLRTSSGPPPNKDGLRPSEFWGEGTGFSGGECVVFADAPMFIVEQEFEGEGGVRVAFECDDPLGIAEAVHR